MRNSTFTLILACLALLCGVVAVVASFATGPSTTTRTLRTAASDCQATGTHCRRMLLHEINTERAQHGTAPLTLDWPMTLGAGDCIGAVGHARHMRDAGQISHDQFPADVCAQYSTAEENVGAAGGTKAAAIQAVHDMMAAEPTTTGHHANWLNPAVNHIGIGFAEGTGGWFVSEEFAGVSAGSPKAHTLHRSSGHDWVRLES